MIPAGRTEREHNLERLVNALDDLLAAHRLGRRQGLEGRLVRVDELRRKVGNTRW